MFIRSIAGARPRMLRQAASCKGTTAGDTSKSDACESAKETLRLSSGRRGWCPAADLLATMTQETSSLTGALFLAGFAAPTGLYPLLTKEYHRYIHMPVDMIQATASKPMQRFLETKLSPHIVRHHMGHHDDDTVNFNLMPGADHLRGVSQKASVAQKEEFRRMGVIW